MKKLLSILMVLTLVLSLTACGGIKCSNCGDKIQDGDGYSVWGRNYCTKCFNNGEWLD